jgi:anti-sigma B factor antagonist
MTECGNLDIRFAFDAPDLKRGTERQSTVMKVAGEVDIATSPDLHRELESLLEAGHVHMVVDMEAVEFIDASGVGVLVVAAQKARTRGGELTIRRPSVRVLRVFDILQLDGHL